MSDRTKLFFQVILGAVLIAAAIFLSLRYLMKGSPFVKVMAVGLIVAVIFLVVSFIRRNSRDNSNKIDHNEH